MELSEAVRRRRMVRTYDPDRPVPPEVVRRLLDLALRSPSAGHSQGRDVVVLADPADRARFWAATTERAADAAADPATGAAAAPDRWLRGMRTAPVLVLWCSDPGAYRRRYAEPDKARAAAEREDADWPVPYWDVDTGMAAVVLLLGAVDEGLGACFFGVPPGRHDAVREAFAVPADRRLVGVVSLGWPAPDRRSPSLARGRRPLEEVVSWGRFGRPAPEG